MKTPVIGTRIKIKNVLFLVDFSKTSEVSLPYAVEIARAFGATVHALHVLTPEPYVYMPPETTVSVIEAMEANAEAGMAQVNEQLAGVPHDVKIVHGVGVWPIVEQQIVECNADLIVMSTHGRTGAQKLLFGSVAEEVFRRAEIPVLTIGPGVRGEITGAAHFRHVVFATDLTPESLMAATHAISLAEENEARLTILHVLPKPEDEVTPHRLSVADAMHKLYELVPKDAESWCRPQAVVEHGEPAERILAVAEEMGADLIVLGVRSKGGHLGAATHLGRTIAHKIVAHAQCPVLTVRS